MTEATLRDICDEKSFILIIYTTKLVGETKYKLLQTCFMLTFFVGSGLLEINFCEGLDYSPQVPPVFIFRIQQQVCNLLI